LPSLSFSGQIAAPWNANAEGLPVPPAERIFQGQFNVEFFEGAFPPVAEDPAQQLTYRMTVEFADWNGGFTEVSFLNTLRVDFVPTEAPVESGVDELVIYYPDESPPLATVEGVAVTDWAPSDPLYSQFGPSDYSTFTFQGVNALGTASSEFFYWNINAPDETFDLGSEPFTVEYFVRLSSSYPFDSYSEALVEVGVFDADGGNFGVKFVFGLYSEVDFGVAPRVRIATDAPIGTLEQFVLPTPSDVASFNHLVLQRHSSLAYTVHYKGELIYSWNESTNVSLAGKSRYRSFVSVIGTTGAGMSQIRITKSARYGTGSFTPPTEAFFTPPS
jgi:hypothetical protein